MSQQTTYQCQQASNPSNSRRKVHTVHKDDTSSDTDSKPQVFIYTLHVHSITCSSWFSTVHTESGKVTFKLDTGVEGCTRSSKTNQ